MSPEEQAARILTLQCQLDKVVSGLACAQCEGSGDMIRHDAHVWWYVVCTACQGTGMCALPKAE